MRKAKATYYAPEGENPVVTMGPPNDPNAVRFIDGQEVELNTNDHGALIDNLKTNPMFDIAVGEEEEDTKPKRGRPRKDDKSVEEKQKDYARASGEVDQAAPDSGLETGEKTVRPGSDYQGGPYPGGKAHGVPGVPPLPAGKENETPSGKKSK